MKNNWKKYLIGDICETVSETYKRNESFVVLVNTSDVFDGKVLNHQSVENIALKGQFKKTFKKNDILYSEIRPANRRFAFVDFENTSNYIASTKLMVLRANDKIVNPRYLFYILSSDDILLHLQHLAETRSGTFPQITFSGEVAPIEVYLPPLEVQEKIVSVLSNLDSKRTIGNKLIRLLIETASTNYSLLFSDEEKNGSIGDYCKLKSGFAFKGSWWTENGAKVIKIGDINQDYLDLSDCSFVSTDKVSYAKDFVLHKGDVVIAMTGATIGKFAIVPESACLLLANQRVGKFFLGENPINRLPFLYCTLKQNDIYNEIINVGQGSAQPNFSGKDIESIKCVIPPENVIMSFNEKNRYFFEEILTLQEEINRINELKNTILPRLISGELDISSLK